MPESNPMPKSPINLRWRIVNGKLPLRERHIRSLEPLRLSPPLIAWIRSRLEWAADNLLHDGAEGVLCLAINPKRDVVVSLEDVFAPPSLSLKHLVEDDDGMVIGVAHATSASVFADVVAGAPADAAVGIVADTVVATVIDTPVDAVAGIVPNTVLEAVAAVVAATPADIALGTVAETSADAAVEIVPGEASAGKTLERKFLEGVVFCERDGMFFASAQKLTTATSTLVCDLASTLGFKLRVEPKPRAFIEGSEAVFLISDEFGYLPLAPAPSPSCGTTSSSAPLSKKIEECLIKIFPPVTIPVSAPNKH